ncbi:MAG: alpha-mannosidase, partial [Spirochaetales bacterium]|nr:alpha-mannosidase [Candidatus Physcosoma equi]
PKKESMRKAARTLSGMFHLMEEYPEFIFLSTQPVQMDHVFQEYSELYEKAQTMFQRGQLEPNGVGLVEADGVLSTGEGLIRNFLYGRQVTDRLFPGYRGDTYVLPDSFGYNGNLPQIMAGCGVKYFITSKLSWNDTNRFPYDTFLWKGIDGTEVKAHMLPGGYNGTNHPKDVIQMWNRVLHKDVQCSLLRTVGEGDGGGGTRREDIEFLRRMKDYQGCPKSSWTTVSKAMENVFLEASDLPVYEGEMYFELHRGTYTSQAQMKQGYRRTTALLHQAEYLLSRAWAKRLLPQKRVEEVSSLLHELWKETVVNQFHDILPGSCVGVEYEEVNAFYAEAEKSITSLIQELAPEGEKELNLSPFKGNGIAPYSTVVIPSSGDRERLSLSITSGGTISSVLYKGRELAAGEWNTLRIGEDVPFAWDAWDLEKDSLDHLSVVSVPYDDIVRQGRIGENSTIRQKIVVDQKANRIDFITDIDWHEDHKVLRVEFPTTVSSEDAVFDIPFAFVRRSTHNNTSFETAQFESPAHKFVLLRDEEVSVSLMSDSKYGYSAKGGLLGMTILKSAKAPDKNADMGQHHFVYSVFVGDGSLEDTIAEAENLNQPHLFVSEDFHPLVRVSEGLAVETVKMAESGKAVVFRVRETLGCSRSGRLEFDSALDEGSLLETDMLEENAHEASFLFHPFQIRTYRITRR